MGLFLHAGANAVNRDQLANLPLPAALGSRHVIRPFIEDVELVSEYLNGVGPATNSTLTLFDYAVKRITDDGVRVALHMATCAPAAAAEVTDELITRLMKGA